MQFTSYELTINSENSCINKQDSVSNCCFMTLPLNKSPPIDSDHECISQNLASIVNQYIASIMAIATACNYYEKKFFL